MNKDIVAPAKAGAHFHKNWIPAFAGMTNLVSFPRFSVIPAQAGIHSNDGALI